MSSSGYPEEPTAPDVDFRMKTRRANQIVRWATVVAWMGLIFFLSAQPRLPQVIPPGLPPIQDVLGHFTVYAVLAVLLWWALRGAGVRHPMLWAFIAAVLYGVSDEWHQNFVPNRHPDVFDLATDLAGAAIALLVVQWRLKARRPLADRPHPSDRAATSNDTRPSRSA
jgi:hypothetical protein